MGVMPCSRNDCFSVLVSNDLGEYRICESCIQDLRSYLVASDVDLTDRQAVMREVDEFMTIGTTMVPREDRVRETLDCLIRRQ